MIEQKAQKSPVKNIAISLKKKLGVLLKNKRAQYVLVLMIAIIGTYFMATSRAATPSASVEPEAGTLAGVTKITDSSASGGEAVQFGGSSSGGLVIISPKSEISQLRQAVTTGNKKAYWEYVKGRPGTRVNTASIPNWSNTVTVTYNNASYTFNPKTFSSVDHASSDSVNAQGTFMLGAATNAYGCALEWALEDNQECGTHAINIIDSWATNFQYARCRTSGVDGRENQVKLFSEWFVPMYTKAIELVWDHPGFTADKKTRAATMLWKGFMLESANMQESDGEVLGHRSVGWNGRMASIGARMNIGLVMKAAGHQSGTAVIDDTIAKLDLILPEVLYYGKAPWHEVLGQPYPEQAYRAVSPTYGGYHTLATTRSYWYFSTNSSTPPPFFIGQTQESGRDIGHTQMGTASLSEALRAMRLNGYGDRFTAGSMGNILQQLGERHAKFYNETLDRFWQGGYANPNSMNCVWQPSEWVSLQLSAGRDCPAGVGEVSFKVGGASSDHGWEFLRTELKRTGYSTPQMDRMVTRLRGTGTRGTNNAAGFGIVDTANHIAWEPLFAPDYQ